MLFILNSFRICFLDVSLPLANACTGKNVQAPLAAIPMIPKYTH